LSGILAECKSEELLKFWLSSLFEGQVADLDFLKDLETVVALVGKFVKIELVGKDPKSPDIVFARVVEVDPLRTEVVGSPNE